MWNDVVLMTLVGCVMCGVGERRAENVPPAAERGSEALAGRPPRPGGNRRRAVAATHRSVLGHASAVAPLLVAAALAGPAVAADSATPPASAHTLRLSEFAFDPAHGEPALPAGWDRSLRTAPDLHLVQFDGTVPGDAPQRL